MRVFEFSANELWPTEKRSRLELLEAGFDYSAGVKSSGLTWNDATLDRWLTDPDLVAADSRMDFHVPKAQERADLIAYFKRQ